MITLASQELLLENAFYIWTAWKNFVALTAGVPPFLGIRIRLVESTLTLTFSIPVPAFPDTLFSDAHTLVLGEFTGSGQAVLDHEDERASLQAAYDSTFPLSSQYIAPFALTFQSTIVGNLCYVFDPPVGEAGYSKGYSYVEGSIVTGVSPFGEIRTLVEALPSIPPLVSEVIYEVAFT
jgi:hypothetical protein